MVYSPLRYPGGKRFISSKLMKIIESNGPIDNYIEPFAGGAGAALHLLFNNKVKNILLNDYDNFISSFWSAILNQKTSLVKLISKTRVSIRHYKKRKQIFNDIQNTSTLQTAFTTLYLNRCNRSGILRAGPIGGYDQKGTWKINARFNKKEIIKKIEDIFEKRNRIRIFNEDAVSFLRNTMPTLGLDLTKTLVYLDPPYYEQGPSLYRTFYNNEQHTELKEYLTDELNVKWVLSYDDVPYINELYEGTRINGIRKNHFANKTKLGKEIVILSDNCNFEDKLL